MNTPGKIMLMSRSSCIAIVLSLISPATLYAQTTDLSRISGWGSSTMENMGSGLSSLAASFGANYYNGGDGGVWSDATLAQHGSRPAQLSFPAGIAASGTSAVSVGNVTSAAWIKAFSGTIAGTPVEGTLAPSGSGWTFTRTGSGATIASLSADFLPAQGLANRYGLQILNIGKNDLANGGSVQTVIERTRTAYDWPSTTDKKTLVMGHFVNTGTPADSLERDKILAVNKALATTYGVSYIDLQSYLTGAQVWKDTGITPTAEDLAQQALGNKPPSLSADALHLNTTGNTAVIRYLIQPALLSIYRLIDFEEPGMLRDLLGMLDRLALAERSERERAWMAPQDAAGLRYIGALEAQTGSSDPEADTRVLRAGASWSDGRYFTFRLLGAGERGSYDDAAGTKDFDGWSIVASAESRYGDWRFGASVGRVSGDFDGDRFSGNLLMPYDASGSGTFVELATGYVLDRGAVTLLPSAWLRHDSTTQDGYSETGSTGRELAFNAQDAKATFGGIGLKVTWTDLGNSVPWLGLAYENRLQESADLISGRLAGTKTSSIAKKPDLGPDDRFLIEGGVSFGMGESGRLDLVTWYDGGISSNGVRGQLSIAF